VLLEDACGKYSAASCPLRAYRFEIPSSLDRFVLTSISFENTRRHAIYMHLVSNLVKKNANREIRHYVFTSHRSRIDIEPCLAVVFFDSIGEAQD
jgi:hypothetical protein